MKKFAFLLTAGLACLGQLTLRRENGNYAAPVEYRINFKY